MAHQGSARFASARGVLALVFVIASCWPAAGVAQVGASVSGTVKDSTGAALPGVTVTVTNKNSGASQTLVTGPDGNYRAVNLPPAPYDIATELSGFATSTKTVTLYVGADATVDFALDIAALAESLTVTGETPLVEVTKSQPS